MGSHIDAELLIAADTHDDLERVRIATENRVRSLAQVKGMGGTPEEQRAAATAGAIADLEHRAELELKRTIRRHPLYPFIRDTVGLGEKQGARLIAAIGDPCEYIDRETGEVVERTVSMLWAYCGYRPGQKRQKGVKSNWNANAKMRAYLCAESCMKQVNSPYRTTYLARRAHTAGTNSDWTDGHSHNDALRVVAKAILKDLWRFARGQCPQDAQAHRAPRAAEEPALV